MSERPPNFFQTFNQTCMFATNATVWLDDSIEQILIEFTQDPTEDIIPDVFTPIGPAVCAVLHVAENVVDLIWHIDLVGPTTDPPVDYLLLIKSYNVINYLFLFCDDVDFAANQIDSYEKFPDRKFFVLTVFFCTKKTDLLWRRSCVP